MVADHNPPNNDYGWSDPKNWKGLFYINRKDKRLFPPKSSGFGYTVNLANPWSIIAAVLIAVALPALVFFLRRH